MANIISARALGEALVEEGLVPARCRNAEVHIPVDGALFIRYDVLVDLEDIPKVIRALSTVAAMGTPAEKDRFG